MERSAIDEGENLAMGRSVKGARERGVNGASVSCFFQLTDALRADARWLATGA